MDKRETMLKVVQLAAQGYTPKRIAEILKLSPGYVKQLLWEARKDPKYAAMLYKNPTEKVIMLLQRLEDLLRDLQDKMYQTSNEIEKLIHDIRLAIVEFEKYL